MKSTETFADFHTRFLHLAGQAQIPAEDLRPDLFDKLTLELQRTVLPIYSTLTTEKRLADECLSLDQGLRRLKAQSDRLKARNAFTGNFADCNTPARTNSANCNTSTPPTREPTPAPTTTVNSGTNSTGFNPMCRQFNSPRLQALSDQRACFTCEQPGHIAPNCPLKAKDPSLVVQEVGADTGTELGKEEP